MCTRLLLATASLMTFVLPSHALASGLVAPRAGAWETPTSSTVTSMHLNPAVLMQLDGQQLQVDAAGLGAWLRYQRERRTAYQRADGFKFKLPLQQSDIDPSKTGIAPEVRAMTSAPTVALAFSLPVGDDFALGIAAVPEYAAVLKFPDVGAHRWQVQEAFVMVEQVSLAAAWRANDWLHLGAAVDLIIGAISIRQTVDLAATSMFGDTFANPPINQPNDFGEDAPPGVRELDVLSRDATVHQAITVGAAFKVGMSLFPHPDWSFALAWQQGADLVFTGDFYMDMDDPFFTTDLASQGLKYPKQVRGKAYVKLPIPSVLRLGANWQGTDALGVHLQVSWLRYSRVKSLDFTVESDDFVQPDVGLGRVTSLTLDRSWLDTVEAELLFDIELTEPVHLGLRAGYHSPVSNDRKMDLISLDGHRLLATAALRWQVTEDTALTAHLSCQHMLERTVTASEYDRGNGVYGLTILVAGLGLQQRF